uniref:Uncharacterized protein n=1 Tax=Arion vulgaris TaxID=1028688 RepID=A0A0B7BK82_9EUPU
MQRSSRDMLLLDIIQTNFLKCLRGREKKGEKRKEQRKRERKNKRWLVLWISSESNKEIVSEKVD